MEPRNCRLPFVFPFQHLTNHISHFSQPQGVEQGNNRILCALYTMQQESVGEALLMYFEKNNFGDKYLLRELQPARERAAKPRERLCRLCSRSRARVPQQHRQLPAPASHFIIPFKSTKVQIFLIVRNIRNKQQRKVLVNSFHPQSQPYIQKLEPPSYSIINSITQKRCSIAFI